MTNLEIAKTLRDAARYMRAHGKREFGLGIHGGPRCALGTIASAAGIATNDSLGPILKYEPLELFPPVLALGTVLGMGRGLMAANLVFSFSDTSTAAEVIDLFESVALQHEIRELSAEPPRMRGEVPEVVHA